MVFTVSNDLLVLQQIYFMPDILNSFLIYLQPLTKFFGVVAVNMLMIFQRPAERRRVAELKQ